MKKLKVIIFILALVIGLTFVKVFGFSPSFSLPTFRIFSSIKGSGIVKTEKREISGFKKVDISRAINVEIIAQKDFNVEVEADENLLEYIKTEVSGDTLKIYSVKRIKPTTKTRVIIAMPELTGAEISGASKLFASNIKTDSFNLDTKGASKIELSGEVNKLNIDSKGASKIEAENLKSANANLDLSGASKVTINATEEIRIDASGASKINYVGEPKNVIKNISGASKVSPK